MHDRRPLRGLVPSKQLGESVFSGSTAHLNEVLDLLPMAYYVTTRRGLGSDSYRETLHFLPASFIQRG